jgi:hypothetical protein
MANYIDAQLATQVADILSNAFKTETRSQSNSAGLGMIPDSAYGFLTVAAGPEVGAALAVALILNKEREVATRNGSKAPTSDYAPVGLTIADINDILQKLVELTPRLVEEYETKRFFYAGT